MPSVGTAPPRSTSILILALLAACGAGMAQAPPGLGAAERGLMEASFEGNLEAVRRLIAEGVPVDAKDAEKRTSLMWAAFNGHTAVVAHLLERGAELDAKDAAGRTALMYASSGPHPQTVQLLLKKGAAVNVRGSLEGFTPLMTAAAEGQLDIVRLLLAHGADPSVVDRDGDTAESFAKQKGHAAVVALLQDPPPESSDH